MYLRGLAFEYRATWESTLLEVGQVESLLGLLLGPAAHLLGVVIPDVAPLRQPGSGPAALWIHLYAVTTLLVVVVPRSVLAAWESWRVRRLAENVPVDLREGYYLRTLARWRGDATRVEVLPYSLQPTASESETLKKLLHGVFGARSHVGVRQSLEYGAEVADVMAISASPEAPDREACRVVLFNLAQTPEREVHGSFLRRIRSEVAERGETLLVLVDRSRYRGAVGSSERWGERMESWRQVVEEEGLIPVAVDLGPGGAGEGPQPEAVDGDPAARIVSALWPAGER
jgi:hypothetical protein